MHHFGFAKVAGGALPRYSCGESVLLRAHQQCIAAAVAQNIEVLAFPDMSLFGNWESSELYQDDKLLGAVQSLSALLSLSADSDLVVVVGLPLINRNMVYQTAVVLQHGKILAVIPRSDVANSSGDITVLQQTVPFATDILIRSRNYTMGVVLDETTLFARAQSLAQQGATLLVKPAACEYTVDGCSAKKAELSAISRHTHTGILYVNSNSAGCGPVFAGDCYLFEDGRLLNESQKNRILFGEIDSQAIKKRQRMAGMLCTPHIEVVPDTSKWQLESLSRTISQTPYLHQPSQALHEILQIQADMICARLRSSVAAKLSVMASGGVNTALVMLSCGRAIQQSPSVKEQITIVISDDMRDLKGTSVSDLTTLAEELQLPVSNCAEDGNILIRTDDLSDLAFGASISRGIYCNISLPKMALYKMLEAAEMALPKGILHLPISEAGRIAYDFFLYYRLRYGFEREKVLFLAKQAFTGVFDAKQIETLYQYFDKHCVPTGQIIERMGQDLLGIVCQ